MFSVTFGWQALERVPRTLELIPVPVAKMNPPFQTGLDEWAPVTSMRQAEFKQRHSCFEGCLSTPTCGLAQWPERDEPHSLRWSDRL